MFQANQMASILYSTTGTAPWLSGLVFCALALLILVGGIKRIGQVTEILVPFMIGIYFIGLFLFFSLIWITCRPCFRKFLRVLFLAPRLSVDLRVLP